MQFLKRETSLEANPNVFTYPTTADITVNEHGSDWLWAATAVMAVSTIAFLACTWKVPRGNRIFHWIFASATLVSTIAYFSMASNLGYTPIIVEFFREDAKVAGVTRAIFYVRYIQYALTTPLLLLGLLLTAALPWPAIAWNIFLGEVVVVSGLVGALVFSSYKWGYFVIGVLALFGIIWNVLTGARRYAKALNANVSKTFSVGACWLMGLWFLYPIAWGVSEGGNVIGLDGEMVFYGILDVLTIPVFGAIMLWGHRSIDPATLGLVMRDYDVAYLPHEHEKGHSPQASGGVTAQDGTTAV